MTWINCVNVSFFDSFLFLNGIYGFSLIHVHVCGDKRMVIMIIRNDGWKFDKK